ncbi:hypothetical protein CBS76997_1635 [Aspergillus niger]|nr:hypothetical protein CBS13152_2914 [Aspergillus niger]KAI3051047.1 hypothetical protein CBS76997_1635 [Aspergillus niger]
MDIEKASTADVSYLFIAGLGSACSSSLLFPIPVISRPVAVEVITVARGWLIVPSLQSLKHNNSTARSQLTSLEHV